MAQDEMIACMRPDEMIAVIQAYKEGKKLQFRDINGYIGWLDVEDWLGVKEFVKFNFSQFQYRVKPEP